MNQDYSRVKRIFHRTRTRPKVTSFLLLLVGLLLMTAKSASSHYSHQNTTLNNEREPTSQDSKESSQLVGKQQPASPEMLRLPFYMRIIATLSCMVILSVGVCGNLLVPLVVIKTKYLRNSTNLFLINLSIADLLVLIVCMPTVLIELHSRPETWLLGELMCKLSNFVEMLAANGSIFTILAISFERYYAICKPLKAGYKCTRLRATIIIACIWILSSILTSPILIMAKSSETVYIDGSLVHNCILETDSYWPKMYVFVSMFAFFCLPLIVLMLVYWLIGRRLVRENLAMSVTTNLASTSNSATTTTTSAATTTSDSRGTSMKVSFNASIQRRRASLRKAASFKSISTFLSSLNQQHNCYHSSLHHQHEPELDIQSKLREPSINSTAQRHKVNKALSLDQHFYTKSASSSISQPNGGSKPNAISANASININSKHEHTKKGSQMKLSLVNQLASHVFRLNLSRSGNDNAQYVDSLQPASTTDQLTEKSFTTNGLLMDSICETHANEDHDLSNEDLSSRVPFLPLTSYESAANGAKENSNTRVEVKDKNSRASRCSFSWTNHFNSSLSSTSVPTSSTILTSDHSLATSQDNTIVRQSSRQLVDGANQADASPVRGDCKPKIVARFDPAYSVPSGQASSNSGSEFSSTSCSSSASLKSPSPVSLSYKRNYQQASKVHFLKYDATSETVENLLSSSQENSGKTNLNFDTHNSRQLQDAQQNGVQLSELLQVQDISKKQQMDSRRQVVIMLAFVVACFFLLFLPYRVFTIWLILSTEDQVQSLGMETYYNLTYFSRILIYLHSAINPIAYNLISTKFRCAFMSILLCRGSSTRRHFTTEYRNKVSIINKKTSNAIKI